MRALALIAIICAACSCKDEPPPKAPEPPPAEEPVVEAEEPHPLMQLRQAYGLPFPPEVEWVRHGPNFIEVGTKLRVSELDKFFRGRLVDYEFVDLGRNDLHIIGLRSTMPRIIITQRAPRMPRSVRYVQQVGAVADRLEGKQPVTEKPEPGKPVQTKLSGGKLLAPGAVYGEPYTPKPGDPLYQERYRANFGKPFGTWILN